MWLPKAMYLATPAIDISKVNANISKFWGEGCSRNTKNSLQRLKGSTTMKFIGKTQQQMKIQLQSLEVNNTM